MKRFDEITFRITVCAVSAQHDWIMIIKSIAISGLLALGGCVLLGANGREEKQIDGQVSVVKMETLGRQMRIARQVRKLSQAELAKYIDISLYELESIENGRKIPVKELVYKA